MAGQTVRAIEPHSESDPAALLLQLLVAFGNVVGRGPHFLAEADQHHLNLYLLLVGETSKARKGTSWGHIDRLFASADDQFNKIHKINKPVQGWNERLASGLSSGEGLIWHVRDALESLDKTGDDAGVTDKRRLVFESEFGAVLRVLGRDGSTLSPVMRNAWDGKKVLQTLTKNSPVRATDAHISIIGHITREELCRYLNATETADGFANRFLMACVKRSKCLPHGGRLPHREFKRLAIQLTEAITFAPDVGRMRRDSDANQLWESIYPELSEGKPGLFGAITARAEAQVMRLASIYALLSHSEVVSSDHLRAGHAVWKYCEDSARFIFGDALGDPIADRILAALRNTSDGLSRTIIRDLFGRNQSADQIDAAVTKLSDLGLAYQERTRTQGRPEERWFAITTKTMEVRRSSQNSR